MAIALVNTAIPKNSAWGIDNLRSSRHYRLWLQENARGDHQRGQKSCVCGFFMRGRVSPYTVTVKG
jgi:hypothetical protein